LPGGWSPRFGILSRFQPFFQSFSAVFSRFFHTCSYLGMVAMRVALLAALLGNNAAQAVAAAAARNSSASAPPLELGLVGEKSLRSRMRMLR
jgi:hypothetical protein